MYGAAVPGKTPEACCPGASVMRPWFGCRYACGSSYIFIWLSYEVHMCLYAVESNQCHSVVLASWRHRIPYSNNVSQTEGNSWFLGSEMKRTSIPSTWLYLTSIEVFPFSRSQWCSGLCRNPTVGRGPRTQRITRRGIARIDRIDGEDVGFIWAGFKRRETWPPRIWWLNFGWDDWMMRSE